MKLLGLVLLAQMVAMVLLSFSSYSLVAYVLSVSVWLLFFLNKESISTYFYLDWLSLPMVQLTLVLFSLIFMIVLHDSGKKVTYLIGLTIIVLFFISNSVLWFYLLFEFSLIPVFLSISVWGVHPERVKASSYLLLYTLLASFPLMLFSVKQELSCFRISMSKGVLGFEAVELLGVSSLLVSMAFLVKVPLFLLHHWLPRAHVEASLDGSAILAGVMLKLGLYGLIRFLSIVMVSKEFLLWLFSVSSFGMVISLIQAMSSDDLKMSVAFSSISHVNLYLCAIAMNSNLATASAVIGMVCHGLVSPLLFFSVTKVYSMVNSRSVLVCKGSMSKFPLYKVLNFLLWSLNCSVPPSLVFLGEILMLYSIIKWDFLGVLLIIPFIVFSGIYCVLNFGLVCHSSSSMKVKSSFSDLVFSGWSCLVLMMVSLMFIWPNWVFDLIGLF